MSELASGPRERVRALVADEPGLHLREFPRRAGLSLGAIRHHLDSLVADGQVVGERAGGYRRFFPASGFSSRERALLACARVAGQRRVLEALVARGPGTFEAIRARTGLSKGSLHWHLKALSAAGALVDAPQARYALGDESGTRMALASTRGTHAATIADAAVEFFDPPR